MHLNGFFRISWLIQLLVGVALFGVSFLIESEVLRSFFSLPAIALAMAVALEVGKATSIIWHRYLSSTGTADYPVITRIFSSGFRIGLVGLSILCSALYLGLQLDRPNLEAVRNGKLAAIDARLQDELGRFDADRAARIAADRVRSRTEVAATRHDYQARVEALRAQLREEMDNVVGGVFKGPRYREVEARLDAATEARDAALTALSILHRQAAERLAATLARNQAVAREALMAKAEAERQIVRETGLDQDERAHHPLVVVFMRMVESVFGYRISAPQFVFLFSLFLSLLMELGILLAFDTVTLAVIPALAAQHREEMMSGALLAEVSGSATRDTIRHREAMDRVRKGADRIMERAHAGPKPGGGPQPSGTPQAGPAAREAA